MRTGKKHSHRCHLLQFLHNAGSLAASTQGRAPQERKESDSTRVEPYESGDIIWFPLVLPFYAIRTAVSIQRGLTAQPRPKPGAAMHCSAMHMYITCAAAAARAHRNLLSMMTLYISIQRGLTATAQAPARGRHARAQLSSLERSYKRK